MGNKDKNTNEKPKRCCIEILGITLIICLGVTYLLSNYFSGIDLIPFSILCLSVIIITCTYMVCRTVLLVNIIKNKKSNDKSFDDKILEKITG